MWKTDNGSLQFMLKWRYQSQLIDTMLDRIKSEDGCLTISAQLMKIFSIYCVPIYIYKYKERDYSFKFI